MSEILRALSWAIQYAGHAVANAELDDATSVECMIKMIDHASEHLAIARVIAARSLAELVEKDEREERACLRRITGAEQ